MEVNTQQQLVSIAFQVQNISSKVDFTLIVAWIAAGAAILSAIIAAFAALQVLQFNIEHQKQWAYITKRSQLIDNGVDTIIKMLFTKLSICDYNTQAAKDNYFALQKDALLIESQLVVYGSQEIADAFYDIKTDILQCPDNEIRQRWEAIYKKGTDYLNVCRKYLGDDLGKDFKAFKRELTDTPPPVGTVPMGVTANTAGGLTITSVREIRTN